MRNFFRSLFQRTAETSRTEPQLKVLLIHNNLNLTDKERAQLIKRLQDTIHDFLVEDPEQEPILQLLEESNKSAAK